MTMILDGTNGAFLPTWTTATRPTSPANGEIGYNSTTGQLDQYVSGAWSSVPTAGASQATPTALGTVYAKQTTSGASPYLTAVGYNAGVSTTGVNNTAVGFQASYRNTSGTANTSLGYNAGYQVTTGTNNVSIGDSVLGSNGGGVTGNYNTGVGSVALTSLSSGANNVGIGYNALYNNDTGGNNTAVGYQAGYASTGGNLTALGYRAAYAATTSNGVFVGFEAGLNTTTGLEVVGVGLRALTSNTTGSYNVAVGRDALYSNTTSSYNTASGYQAGKNIAGDYNVAIGALSIQTNTANGSSNTAVGANSLNNLNGGSANAGCGYSSLYYITTGNNNSALGHTAGAGVTTGNYNTFLGYATGFSGTNLTTGSFGLYLGAYASASATSVTYEMVLSCNNTTVAGKGTQTGYIYPNGGGVYQGNNSAAWSVSSDQRLKKNIVDNNVGLDKVIQIQVRNFEYRTEDEINDLPKNQAIKKEGVQLGVIAQELQQVLPDCVKTESTGVMSVDSTDIMWHMINAIKELNAKVIALETKLGV